MAKKDSVEVIYTPRKSMPKNFPGDFKVAGWGSVVLHPGVPTLLGVNLVRRLISDCGDRVKLADPNDWKSLGKEFKPAEPAAEKAPAKEAPEPADEAAQEAPAEDSEPVISPQEEKAGEA